MPLGGDAPGRRASLGAGLLSAPGTGSPRTGSPLGDGAGPTTGTAVRVVPDVRGLDRAFDYRLPDRLAERVREGTIVRVPLQGRRVRGWVVELAGEPPAGVALRDVIEVVSAGPPPAVVDLARFAAWRYAGRLRPFLVAGSPPRIVPPGPPAAVPVLPRPPRPADRLASPGIEGLVREALARREAVVRLPPAAARLGVVETVLAEAGGRGGVLVVVPAQRDAERLAGLLSGRGWRAALLPGGWASAAGAHVVVGTRDAAFAPVEALGAVVLLDAHAEALVETRAPTWRADVVAAERARRAGVPCVLVSGCPTPEQAVAAPVLAPGRDEERAGWASLVVLDRRGDDPRTGLYAEALAGLVRSARAEDPTRPVVCVLNRTGRARLLACAACGELARCEGCGAALREAAAPSADGEDALGCPACGASRARFCAGCGGLRLKVLRVGTARAAEELAALTGLEVGEVSGPRPVREPAPAAPVLVGTEAVLHRVGAASLVVFLDLDQELLAPRLNGPVRALALLGLASRLAGGRRRRRAGPGRVAVQTRLPDHEVVRAALHGDPGILLAAELERRSSLGLPPARAVALLTGDGLDAARATLADAAGEGGGGLEAVRTGDRLLVRATDAGVLAAGLARLPVDARPRIEVDPLRL